MISTNSNCGISTKTFSRKDVDELGNITITKKGIGVDLNLTLDYDEPVEKKLYLVDEVIEYLTDIRSKLQEEVKYHQLRKQHKENDVLDRHKHKMKAVEALKTLCEDDVLVILDSTKAIENLFEDVDTNKGLVPASQHKVLDDLVDKYGEIVVFSTIVSKMTK